MVAVKPSRLGLLALAAGLVVLVVARLAVPSASPPLYDGVVPLEPYRWLNPPLGQPGGAEGVTATAPLTQDQNQLVGVATPELSPQAQVFAAPGALTLPAGASSIAVSIDPIDVSLQPDGGYLAGNVYRFTVTDQSGAPVSAADSARVTIVLRAADASVTSATIERFDGLQWQPLDTSPAGSGAFIAVVTEFGDFAVVAPGTSPFPTAPPSGQQPNSPLASTRGVPAPSRDEPPSAGLSAETLLAAIVVVVAAAALVVTVAAWRLVARRRLERNRRSRPRPRRRR